MLDTQQAVDALYGDKTDHLPVRVVLTEASGKALQAKRALAKDAVLVDEPAQLAYALPDNEHVSSCANCLRCMEAFDPCALVEDRRATGKWPRPAQSSRVRCDDCKLQWYCSPLCQKLAARRFHAAECPREDATRRAALEALHAYCRETGEHAYVGLLRMYAHIVANADRLGGDLEAAQRPFSGLVSDDFVGVTDQALLRDSKPRALIHAVLGGDAFEAKFPHLAKHATFQNMLGKISLNSTQIDPASPWFLYAAELRKIEDTRAKFDAMNVYMEHLGKLSREDVEAQQVHGAAIYFVHPNINHSCTPNAKVANPHGDHRIVVKATRDIGAGEEITLSYINEMLPVQERQQQLMVQYMFRCACPRCTTELLEADLGTPLEQIGAFVSKLSDLHVNENIVAGAKGHVALVESDESDDDLGDLDDGGDV